MIQQDVLDTGLLDNVFYLDQMPATRISKITLLLGKWLPNFFTKRSLTLLSALFKKKTSLSLYNFIFFLGKPEYDIIHAHFGPNGNYLCELKKIGLFKKAKFVTTFHGFDLEKTFKPIYLKHNLFNLGDIFTTNSFYSKRKLLMLECDEAKIHLLPVGLNVARFTRTNVGNNLTNPLRILFVGRLVAFKAPGNVVEIGRLLKQKYGVPFLIKIIGDGPLEKVVSKKIADYHLENEIELCGARNQDDIVSEMNDADIFLYPGITYDDRAENQGLVLQEAQAMELPVFISDAGGMKEGIIDGVTGFVFPEKNLDAFAKKIAEINNDRSQLFKMGKAARQFVLNKFGSLVLNRQLLELYISK